MHCRTSRIMAAATLTTDNIILKHGSNFSKLLTLQTSVTSFESKINPNLMNLMNLSGNLMVHLLGNRDNDERTKYIAIIRKSVLLKKVSP